MLGAHNISEPVNIDSAWARGLDMPLLANRTQSTVANLLEWCRTRYSAFSNCVTAMISTTSVDGISRVLDQSNGNFVLKDDLPPKIDVVQFGTDSEIIDSVLQNGSSVRCSSSKRKNMEMATT